MHKPLRIAYVAAIRLPTEKAHGYAIMRTCAAWKALGHDVTLYVPRRGNSITEDPFSYYGLEKTFPVEFVPCTDWVRFARILGPLAFVLQNLAFLRVLKRRLPQESVVYSRDTLAVWYFGRKRRVVWNSHTVSSYSFLTRLVAAKAAGIVCLSKGVEDDIKCIAAKPTVVSRSGTDANPYRNHGPELRGELGLPDGSIALYTGHLFAWKGPDVILAAAELALEVQFVLVGGTEADVARYREYVRERNLKNVHVLGHKKHSLIPKYLVAADVLLIPNTGDEAISVRHTSPLKLYEYMASGKPIAASDLPSLRETLSESSAYFFKAGDASALADVIKHVLANDHEARNRAQQALIESEEFSWENQAKISADFMQSLS